MWDYIREKVLMVKRIVPTRVVSALPEDEIVDRLSKKNILIVGGTSGIGRALALSCLKRGANVTIVGRRQPDEQLAKATFTQADLTTMRSARKLADTLPLQKYDIAVFTNGIMPTAERKASEEGVELDMAVSMLSRLAIVSQFKAKNFGADRVDKSVKPRVFIMGFPGTENTCSVDDFNSEKNYSVVVAHMNTVVGNEALVSWLSGQLGSSANLYGLNPGMIKTEIRDSYLVKGSWLSTITEFFVGMIFKSADDYSERVLVPCLVSPQLEDSNGALIDSDAALVQSNPWLEKDNNRERVMDEAIKLLDRALSKTPA